MFNSTNKYRGTPTASVERKEKEVQQGKIRMSLDRRNNERGEKKKTFKKTLTNCNGNACNNHIPEITVATYGLDLWFHALRFCNRFGRFFTATLSGAVDIGMNFGVDVASSRA